VFLLTLSAGNKNTEEFEQKIAARGSRNHNCARPWDRSAIEEFSRNCVKFNVSNAEVTEISSLKPIFHQPLRAQESIWLRLCRAVILVVFY
jgi:hypothetical protein